MSGRYVSQVPFFPTDPAMVFFFIFHSLSRPEFCERNYSRIMGRKRMGKNFPPHKAQKAQIDKIFVLFVPSVVDIKSLKRKLLEGKLCGYYRKADSKSSIRR
jgi:hypothetical protein